MDLELGTNEFSRIDRMLSRLTSGRVSITNAPDMNGSWQMAVGMVPPGNAPVATFALGR